MGMWEHYNIFLFIQKGYDSLSNILEMFTFHFSLGSRAGGGGVMMTPVTCVV